MPSVHIVGILNVTPDSYFDGGKFVEVEAAVRRVGDLLAQGADIIDIGGESTGPNSKSVPLEEELGRVIPMMQAIKKTFPDVQLSVDTYKSAVAKAAIDAGVAMVNDVTAGRGDPEMFSVVAQAGVPIVLMFAKDSTPRTTVAMAQYDDVVLAVKEFLADRKAVAMKAGVPGSNIILDPGMGHFLSGDAKYSLEMLARLRELEELGSPIYVSPSRKSFLAGAENLKTVDRLPGTIAASAIAVLNGASYVRTHDVLEVRRACDIAGMIRALR